MSHAVCGIYRNNDKTVFWQFWPRLCHIAANYNKKSISNSNLMTKIVIVNFSASYDHGNSYIFLNSSNFPSLFFVNLYARIIFNFGQEKFSTIILKMIDSFIKNLYMGVTV